MATIIPFNVSPDFHNSIGEMKVLSALEKLPDSYIVFQSVLWSNIDEYNQTHNGESDFLVYSPERGFLTIEVKTGGVSRDISGEWFTVDRDGTRHRLSRSPMSQSLSSKYHFEGVLSSSANPLIQDYEVNAVVWFPTIEDTYPLSSQLPAEYVVGANTFTGRDLADPERTLLHAFNHYSIQHPHPDQITPQVVKETISLISPSFHLVPSFTSQIHDQDFLFNRLTTEQATLLDYLEEQRIAGIQGVGGTGKTMLALERARRIPSNEHILFLCFNKLLLNYLRDTYSSEMPNVTFTNLHELRAETLHVSEIAKPSEITDFLNHYYDYDFDFDHIIIDEGQDFHADHLAILSDIARLSGGYFYVFYDKNQLVHAWDNSTLDWFRELDCRLVLLKNCRNTFAIASTAYAPVQISNITLASPIMGDKPIMKNCTSVEQALDTIASTIREYTDAGYTKKQIAILTVKSLEKSILHDKTSIGGYKLITTPGENGILFTTARKFKGLETDAAIIIDIDADAFHDDNAKCVFYVASTRAKHSLSYVSILDEDARARLCADLGITRSGSKKRLLEEALSVSIVNQ